MTDETRNALYLGGTALIERVEATGFTDDEAAAFAAALVAWSGGNNALEQSTLYLNVLLPYVRRLFATRFENDHSDLIPPDVLVQTVGFSWAPLVLAAEFIAPTERIVLLHSDETTRDAGRLEQVYGERGVETEPRRIEASNPTDVYSAIHEAVREFGDRRVAVDVTGGKKTMVTGGVLAAALRDTRAQEVPLYYVDFEAFNSNAGVPVPGTEFLSRLPNPLAVFSERELAAARRLFEGNHYAGALETLEDDDLDTSRGVTGDRVELLVALRAVAVTYEAWDAGRLDDARTGLDGVPAGLRDRHAPALDEMVRELPARDPMPYLERPRAVLRMALDYLAAGDRQIATGRPGAGLLHIAAALELTTTTWALGATTSACRDAVADDYRRGYRNRTFRWGGTPLAVALFEAPDHLAGDGWDRDWSLKREDLPSDTRKRLCDGLEARNTYAHRETAGAAAAVEPFRNAVKGVVEAVWTRLAADAPPFADALHQHAFASAEEVEALLAAHP